MKRLPAPPLPANDDGCPPVPSVRDSRAVAPASGAPAPAHHVNRAGRTLAVLLEVEDPRGEPIRVALDRFGAVAGTGFIAGTIH